MANEQNLVKGGAAHKFTLEEQSRGGKKSAEVRRRKRSMRESMEMMVHTQAPEKIVKAMEKEGFTDCQEYIDAVNFATLNKALKGDQVAAGRIMELLGEKIEKIELSEMDNTAKKMDEFFKKVEL